MRVLGTADVEPDQTLDVAIRPVVWIGARLGAHRFDRALADGANPRASGVQRRHAVRICSPRERRRLAESIRRLVDLAEHPRTSLHRIRAPEATVRGATGELSASARLLEEAAPVSPAGVARLRLLLSDGTGLLYRGTPERFRAEVRAALNELGRTDLRVATQGEDVQLVPTPVREVA
jgi:hypothetical protein